MKVHAIKINIHAGRNPNYIGFFCTLMLTVRKFIDIPPNLCAIAIIDITMNGTYDFASGEIIPHQQIKIRWQWNSNYFIFPLTNLHGTRSTNTLQHIHCVQFGTNKILHGANKHTEWTGTDKSICYCCCCCLKLLSTQIFERKFEFKKSLTHLTYSICTMRLRQRQK